MKNYLKSPKELAEMGYPIKPQESRFYKNRRTKHASDIDRYGMSIALLVLGCFCIGVFIRIVADLIF